MRAPRALRRTAAETAAPFPPLLADAERLAATVLLGEHGRRRAGMGDEFWQYRPATEGDEARLIDWRRSAKSDVHFIRQREWQAAQSVMFWIDNARAMDFTSDEGWPRKVSRARTLALALSILLVRAGERVGLTTSDHPPRSGEAQLLRLAEELLGEGEGAEYGAPETRGMRPHSAAVFFSDFLGPLAGIESAVARAADRDVRGVLFQVLDPQEESFPFDGRTIFESVGGTMSHETRRAGDLRSRYLERLATRRDALTALCRATGWQLHVHHTDQPGQAALLWLHQALQRGRR
ncbi:DUF58 domain-containing protein [Pseudoruegeria sp. SHC-113]|uniref:DUF58 domain-containing protein n=1 Tax=Pseudoruegeria sp. SHC-113 TaxID=2855439 RepID=UPI0021BB7846|nr:DUF58 domain-containing protein [Pseudoruegeria sp. SHC-113]